ncbi:MAG: DmsC/YnfH family molybdoenzyme membrane anchor subunit [Bacteroidota bacterium]|nr:DmsC/YnfH family molybdoenzyme membrane anchor subunit [Bacteroidota bacterium]
MVSVFVFLLITYGIVFWKKPGNQSILKMMSLFGIIAGLYLIYCMSRIYTLSTIPVWNSAATPVEFYTAAFLLGAILLMMVFQGRLFKLDLQETEYLASRISVLYLLLVILLFLDLGNTVYTHYVDFKVMPMTAEDPGYILNLAKSILHLAAIFIIISQFYQFNQKKHFSGVGGIRLVFFVLILAEIIGRYFFYAYL